MPNKILVLGSSNVDLILRIPRFHQPGETITGDDLATAFGGKGANQAIAAMRLGGNATFITKLGNDQYGKAYRSYLLKNGIVRSCILQDKKRPTGVAFIELIPKGENRIIVSPGANRSMTGKDLRRLLHQWKGIRVFMTQMEIPLPAVQKGLKMAKDQGAITLLNPSPATSLTSGILPLVDFIVPNEWEAGLLTGIKMKGSQSLPEMARKLIEKGATNVVITLGARGLFFQNRETAIRMRAFRVNALDSTSAGDAFMGALACGLSEGKPLKETLRFAAAAGALATTKLGAQPSLPSRKELERFLDAHKD
jgi:ribokinase